MIGAEWVDMAQQRPFSTESSSALVPLSPLLHRDFLSKTRAEALRPPRRDGQPPCEGPSRQPAHMLNWLRNKSCVIQSTSAHVFRD